jgi:predicted O-methyltransferase YrrM
MQGALHALIGEGLWASVASFDGSAASFNAPFSSAPTDEALIALFASTRWETVNVPAVERERLAALMAHLDAHLAEHGARGEGGSAAEQQFHLHQLVAQLDTESPPRVLEVGFNEGHSACAILASRSDVTLVSYDLGEHASVGVAKAFVDERFPGRHTLVTGDSTVTLAAAAEAAQESSLSDDAAFDLCFIDGGHSLEVASADLRNCARLGVGTVVVMDDVAPEVYWGRGPAEAWQCAVAAGWVKEDSVWECNTAGAKYEGAPRRAWALGRFTSVPPAAVAATATSVAFAAAAAPPAPPSASADNS